MVSFWARPVVDDTPHCFIVNINNYPKIIPSHLNANFMLSNIALNFDSSCFVTEQIDDYLADNYPLGTFNTRMPTDIQKIKYRYIAEFALSQETILERIRELNNLQLKKNFRDIGNKKGELYHFLKEHLMCFQIDELNKETRQWDELINKPADEPLVGWMCTLL